MSNKPSMRTLAGLATARGFAAGPVYIYRGGENIPISEFKLDPAAVEDEVLRLHRACGDVRRDIESLIAVLKERTSRSDVMVFECHLMLLDDPLLIGEAERSVREDMINA